MTVNAYHAGCVMCSAQGDTWVDAFQLARLISSVLYPHLWRRFEFAMEATVPLGT